MAQLELKYFDVRLAKEDAEGHEPCPVGFRVWLDVATNAQTPDWECHFQEFSVVADAHQAAKRRLQPVGAAPGTAARLDTSLSYWCLWSPSGGPSVSPPTTWDRADGFGYPMRAEANNGQQLILPNYRKLFIREFNLSGTVLQPGGGPQVSRDQARRLCEELHVRLEFETQQKPGNFPDLASAKIGNEPRLFAANDAARNRVVLPLNQAPWVPPGPDDFKRIVLIWLARIEATTAMGESLVVPSVCPGSIQYLLPGPEPSGLIPRRPAIFMDTGRSGGKSLVHEIMHCLLADPGLGRNNHKKFAGWEDNVKGVLRALRLRASVEELYGRLPGTEHEITPSTNLMRIDGGSGSIGQAGLLGFLQGALIRRAPELRWKR